MNTIRIQAPTSSPMDTMVTVEVSSYESIRIPGVAAVMVDIRPGQENQAKLELVQTGLDVHAKADLSDFIRAAATQLTDAQRNHLIAEINALPPNP